MSTGCRRRWSEAAPVTGGHVWVFFSAPVAASARRAGSARCCSATAMTRRAELDLASYDRLFPNQDFLPAKGFGNLIALPLQGRCRAAGTSVFLDPADARAVARPVGVPRLARDESRPSELERLLTEHEEIAVGAAALSPQQDAAGGTSVLPAEIRCTIGADLAIATSRCCRRRCSPSSSISPRCTTRSSTSGNGCGSQPTRRRG